MGQPQSFSIHSERTGRVHRLIPVGELDIATAPMLREDFEAVLADRAAEMIVVDLTELSFMDSTGIRALLEMNDLCEHADRLRIINGSPAVVRMLDLTAVRERLPIISSDDDPLAPLRSPPPRRPVQEGQ
jgi:anti-sigma B factor antagonist